MLTTQCPSCQTSFRVTSEQLEQRHGMVRCGQCRHLFNGAEHLSSSPEPTEMEPLSDSENTAVTLPWQADPNPPTLIVTAERETLIVEPTPLTQTQTLTDDSVLIENVDADNGNENLPPLELTPLEASPPTFLRQKKHSRLANFLYGMLCLGGLLLLLAQVTYVFHDTIAAHWPTSKPGLQKFCTVAHCTVSALQQPDAIVIEISDLQAAPSQKDIYTFSITLRNRSRFTQQLPALEIWLTNLQNKPLVRRVFLPNEYLEAGQAMLQDGLPGNAELAAKLYWQTAPLDASGYRVYLFYP